MAAIRMMFSWLTEKGVLADMRQNRSRNLYYDEDAVEVARRFASDIHANLQS